MATGKRRTVEQVFDPIFARKSDIVRRQRSSIPRYIDMEMLIREMKRREALVFGNATHFIFVKKGYISILN